MGARNAIREASIARRCVVLGLATSFCLAISGCSTPKGTLSYYLPKADTSLKVTQTLACNGAGDHLVQVVNVTPATAYTSDLAAGAVTIEPRKVDGWLANADIGFAFTDDGRLNGVNITTVGQGGEVLKDVAAVAKTVAAAAAAQARPVFDAKAACKTIAGYVAKQPSAPVKDGTAKDAATTDKTKDKGANGSADSSATSTPTVTLNYTVAFGYRRTANTADTDLVEIDGANPYPIPIDTVDASLFSALAKNIPGLGFSAKVSSAKRRAIPRWDAGDSETNIVLPTVANATVEVQGLAGDMSKVDVGAVWQQTLPVPLTGPGDRFNVPIPKAATFGTRKFTLALTDYGSISKIEYSATGGVTGAADAFNTIASAVAGENQKPTAAQQAATQQAKGDLIYEQRRAAICMANPDACPAK